jgi:metal-sulfur cluster biosynthetic enzyme
MKNNQKMPTASLIKKQLKKVIDPELGISIVDLGLVYEIKINGANIYVKMTLTTIGCPLFSIIEDDIRNKIAQLGVDRDKINIELTFDPPWTMEQMSPAAKAMLGI